MALAEATIEVDVDAQTAYERWAAFDELPRFLHGVDEVRQLDDATLEWTATIGDTTRTWQATITERRPGERIAWASVDGARSAGVVSFEPVERGRTRVHLTLDVEADVALEDPADAERRVGEDLRRFKELVEQGGAEADPDPRELTGMIDDADDPDAPRTTETWS